MRGAFIVFEGLDRSGKSTQCKKLEETLNNQGIPAKAIRFPDRSTLVGESIHKYLSCEVELPNEAVHLLFSANRWEFQRQIKELLQDGITVLADRYSYSGVAYSGAKPGMNVEWCKNSESGLPKPDLVLYFQMPLDMIERRRGFGGERYEVSSFLEKVESIYMTMKDETWKVVNAEEPIDDIHEKLKCLVCSIIDEVKTKPLTALW